MRFRIQFDRNSRARYLPIDYQYFLSAWIYKVIASADKEFSDFLHSQGYSFGTKQFKLFCYSPLSFGKPKLWKEKALLEIASDKVTLNVSFQLGEAAERFIIGLFNNQQLYIGDQFNGIDLVVKQVERLPEPALSEVMYYQAYSPVVVSRKDPNRYVYAQYMSPVMDEYEKFLKDNLIGKYNSVPGAKPLPDDFTFKFQLFGTPKSKLITIKPYTPQQSKVRGFLFEFELTCPAELHRLVISAGIGEKNSMGFGWVEAVDYPSNPQGFGKP